MPLISKISLMEKEYTLTDYAKHVLLSFLVVVVIFACAVVLNYAEHFMDGKIDTWLLVGMRILSIFAILADGIYFIGLCIIVIVRACKAVKEEW